MAAPSSQPAVAGRPAAAGARNNNDAQNPIWSNLRIMLALFALSQLLTAAWQNWNKPETPSVIPAAPASNEESSSPGESITASLTPANVAPLWSADDQFNAHVILSDSKTNVDPNSPISYTFYGLGLDQPYDANTKLTFNTTPSLRSNGSVYAHLFVAKEGFPWNPEDPNYDPENAYHIAHQLTQYLTYKKPAKQHLLLGSEDESEHEAEEEQDDGMPDSAILSFWHPNITLELVSTTKGFPYDQQNPVVRDQIVLDPKNRRDESGQVGFYYPIIFNNQFWQLKKDMTVINSTTPSLTANIHFKTSGMTKFQIMVALDDGFKKQAATGGASELDQFKTILLDTSPYLLILTAAVSLLHTLFEFLAFKSDISHWKQKKDNVGVSVRSIIANVIMQTIIFLYLLDNNEETSWMILLSQGSGILVEAWKITKAVDIKVERAPGLIPFKIQFNDKHALSDTEKKTQEYDAIAFKYMYIGGVPLILAYAVYSLLYQTHKSWYSFIIATLVGSVYAYGFLMLVPSIYINYRLKSVAHIPRKALVYKFLNTFIDDLFAFVVKMPILHRLATLRDDVIFFVYLYQTWLYRVDYSRVNEFGQGGGDQGDDEVANDDDKEREKEKKKPETKKTK